MPSTANVVLRDHNITETVRITDIDKPQITESITEKWQRIINLIAKLIDVPSGLIMRLHSKTIEIFIQSSNRDNPYQSGSEKLGNGLYCETVIGTDSELLISNALGLEAWKDNPDIKLNMISYYGLPLKWPDNEFFGTICVLDNKTNRYNDTFKALLQEFALSIEKDLEFLIKEQQLTELAERDALTSTYNRRKTDRVLSDEFSRCRRFGAPLSVIIMDLNNFKEINDTYGHDIGDKILIAFSESVSNRIRQIDIFGRWGGDEFLLICPNTTKSGAELLMNDLLPQVVNHMQEIVDIANFSHGIAEYLADDDNFQNIVKRADVELYKAKKKTR